MGMRPPRPARSPSAASDITALARPRHRREAGIGYIPEDRHRHGLLLEAPLWENRILGHQTQEPNVNGPWIDRKGAREDTERDRRDVRRPDAGHRRPRVVAVRRQPAEADRRPGDERRPQGAHRRPPDPRRRRRSPGGDLGPHPRGPRERPGGAADLRRPRRADRPVRHAQGDPARPPRRRRRPGARHARGARLGDDRRGRARRTIDGSRFDAAPPRLALAAPLLAIVFAALVTAIWCCSRPATRRSARAKRRRLRRQAAAVHGADPQPRHRLLPVGARRRHRLPDEPVQHRRRRPVPARRLAAAGSAARSRCPSRCTSP